MICDVICSTRQRYHSSRPHEAYPARRSPAYNKNRFVHDLFYDLICFYDVFFMMGFMICFMFLYYLHRSPPRRLKPMRLPQIATGKPLTLSMQVDIYDICVLFFIFICLL